MSRVIVELDQSNDHMYSDYPFLIEKTIYYCNSHTPGDCYLLLVN